MVKITRFLRQFGGQPLKTKDLAVWRVTCTCCGVLQNAQPAKSTTRVNSCVQDVTGLGLNKWSSAVAGHVVDSPCPVMGRPSSQGQYQAGNADKLGNHTRNAHGVPWGNLGDISKYGVLPYTHLGTLLSGIALAWVAYTIQTPMEGVLCHLH